MSDFSIDLDFTGVEKLKDWEPIPDGNYEMRIVDVVREKAKKADAADNIKITFEVEEPENRKLFKYFNLGEKSMPFFQKFLEELFGQEVEGNVSLSADDMIGKRIACTIKVQPRSDDPERMQNEVVPSSWSHLPF